MQRIIATRRFAAAASAAQFAVIARRYTGSSTGSQGKSGDEASVTDNIAYLVARNALQAAHAATVAAESVRYHTGTLDPTNILMTQHRDVQALFAKIDAVQDPASRHILFEQCADLLAMHFRLEEEFVYPAAQAALQDRAKIPEKKHEHIEDKKLMVDMLRMHPTHAEFEAKFNVLRKTIVDHLTEEEKILFPEMRRVIDEEKLKKLGERMHERFLELAKQEKPRNMLFEDIGKAEPSHH
jgi:iron-sulfur cluster repair protein YtfE (RIC family)